MATDPDALQPPPLPLTGEDAEPGSQISAPSSPAATIDHVGPDDESPFLNDSDPFSETARERFAIERAADEVRPHPELATEAEAMTIAQDLIASATVQAKIQIFEARDGEGMPMRNGEHRPLLISWSEQHPDTARAMAFRCSVGELWRLWTRYPQGAWVKDFEARTVRRSPA